MAPTKNEVANTVSNQQALVKRLLGNNRPKAIRRVIPGGQTMLEDIDQTMLGKAIFTYLRSSRYFTNFKLSFAREPKVMDLEVVKVQDFPFDGKYSIWEVPSHGKHWLADQIASVLNRQKLVYIEAKNDGLYVATERNETDFGPGTENWEPFYEWTPARKGEYSVPR